MTCLDRFQQQGKLSRLPFVGDLTPNDEFSGAPVTSGTRAVGKRVRWNEQLGLVLESLCL